MKFSLQTITNGLTTFTGRTGLQIQKYSPEILLGAGITLMGVGAFMACKATLRADVILDEHNDKMSRINTTKDMAERKEAIYTEDEYRRDVAVTWTQTLVGFGKLYAPAIGTAALGVGCILWSHRILSGRVMALGAAYKVIESQFSNYRKNVTENFGEEVDKQMRYGLHNHEVTVTEKDENGNDITKVTDSVAGLDLSEASDYARYFDETNPNWNRDPERNMMFIKTQMAFANDLLNSRGHVFLNEVYDLLDFPRTKAGAVVGWVKGNGDDYADFLLYSAGDPNRRAFVNGLTPSTLIDFNVDGVIYDKI